MRAKTGIIEGKKMKAKTIIKVFSIFIMIGSLVCMGKSYLIAQDEPVDPGAVPGFMPQPGHGEAPEYVPGEVLVKFKEGVDPGTVLKEVAIEAAGLERIHSIQPAVSKYRKFLKENLRENADGMYEFRDKIYESIDEVDDVEEEKLFEEAYQSMNPIEQGLYRSYKVVLPGEINAEEAIILLKGHPDIEYAEPNYIMKIMQ